MDNSFFSNKKSIKRLFVAIGIIVIFSMLTGFFLGSREKAVADYSFDAPSEEFSQVVVSGQNYSLNEEQENAVLGNFENQPEKVEETNPIESNETSIVDEIANPKEDIQNENDTTDNVSEIEQIENEGNSDPEDSSENSDEEVVIVNNDAPPDQEQLDTEDENETLDEAPIQTGLPDNQIGGGESEGSGSEGENNNEEEGDIVTNKTPIIECSLANEENIEGTELYFTVRCLDYHNTVIDAFYYQVQLNGENLYSTGRDGNEASVYRNTEPLNEGQNSVRIYVEDAEGNNASVEYLVYSQAVEEELADEYVQLVVDASLLGKGVLLSASERIYKNESAAHFVDRVLNDYGFSPQSVNNMYGYYLQRLYKPGILGSADSIVIPDSLKEQLGELYYEDLDQDSLGERDLNGYSGWVYLYNGSYMGVGLSNITLYDGDEILICFTLANGAEYDGSISYYGEW